MNHPTSQRAKEIFFIIGGLLIIAGVVAAIVYGKSLVAPPPPATRTMPEQLTDNQKAQLLQSAPMNTSVNGSASSTSPDNSQTDAAHAKLLESMSSQGAASSTTQLSQDEKMKLLQGH